MKMITPIILLAILLVVPLIKAEQTVKTIEIPISYIAQTSADTDYIITKIIQSPDGIAEIISMEIIIKGDFQANTNIKARVRKNGDNTIYDCEPSSWITPNLNTPNYETVFDCSSLVNQFNFKTGKIDLGMKTDKVAQNVKAFLRITYYNNPKPSMNVKGTEYQITDNTGKVFLQLLNDDKLPIENASCYVSLYNPDTTIWINKTLMSYIDEGLFHYDVSIPNQTGVYIISAFCDIPYSSNVTAWDDWECNDWNCGSGWKQDWFHTPFCDITTANSPRDSYHLRNSATGGCDANRKINISNCTTGYLTFWAKATSLEAGDDCRYYYKNDTDAIELLTLSNGDDDNIYRYYSYEICQYNYGEDSGIRFFADVGSNDGCYIDDIEFSIADEYNETIYERVRGSGEVHVNDWFSNISVNATAEVNETAISENVWSYFNRTLTQNVTVDINYTLIAENVWSWTGSIASGLLTNIAQAIWDYSDRNLTYYPVAEVNVSEISENVWNYSNRTVDGIKELVNATINNAELIQQMWNYTNRTTKTPYSFVGQTEYHTGDDGLIVVRISDGNNPIEDANCTIDIVYDNLTFFVNDDNMTQPPMKNGLYYYQFTIPNSEGVYPYLVDCEKDASNYYSLNSFHVRDIDKEVWQYTPDRNLTYYEHIDLTNYTQIQDLVWNATTRTLTEFNFTIGVNESLIADAVWDAVNRTLTDYNQSDLTDYNLIQTMVWNATIRTLTEFNFTVDIDESEIWNYAPRNLTYYETANVTNLTVNVDNNAVAQAVWNYNGTVNNNIINQFTNPIECYIVRTFFDEEGWGVDIPIC